MKQAIMVVLVVILGAAAVQAQGSLHMFADTTSLAFSSDLGELETREIYLAYSSNNGQGPDGIRGAEFRVLWDDDRLVTTGAETYYSHIVPTHMGDIRSGVALAFNDCHGVGKDYLFFGQFTVMAMEDIGAGSDPIILSIVTSPTAFEQEPLVVECSLDREILVVTGRKFVFPEEAYTIATSESSWGTIKAMYRQ